MVQASGGTKEILRTNSHITYGISNASVPLRRRGCKDPTFPYSIVSHTWGRWRKKGGGASLPGVSEWLVPENTRFEVTDLPCILKRAGFAERYVWLDWLCIP